MSWWCPSPVHSALPIASDIPPSKTLFTKIFVAGSSHAFPRMFLVFFQVMRLVHGCLGVLDGLVVYVVLGVVLGGLRAIIYLIKIDKQKKEPIHLPYLILQ